MVKDDLRSQSLDLLRFPLAVVVLIIHTFSTNGFVLQGVPVSIEDKPVLLEINYFIKGFLQGQSVPIYFFISGFVFFLGVELTREKYLQKLKNRVKTLLIPYIIWNVLAVLKKLFLLLPCFSSFFPNAYKIGLDFSLTALLETFWDHTKGIFIFPEVMDDIVSKCIYPANVPLWFVRDLMLVVLCAPLIYWVLKHTRYYAVLLLGVSWFVLDYWDLGHFNQLLTALFFFSWGAYMSVNQKNMIYEFQRFFKASMLLYPLLALLFVWSMHCFPVYSDFLKRMNVFVGLFFAYNLSSWLLMHRVCRVSPFLASSSFFIYVSHSLLCGDLVRLLFFLFRPSGDWGMLVVYVSAVVITTSLLLLVFYLLRRNALGLLNVLAGRK